MASDTDGHLGPVGPSTVTKCDLSGARPEGAPTVLADGFSALSPRVGMAQGLSTTGAELPELMTAGRWDSPTMPAKYTGVQATEREAVAPYYREGLRGSKTT